MHEKEAEETMRRIAREEVQRFAGLLEQHAISFGNTGSVVAIMHASEAYRAGKSMEPPR